MKFRGIGTGVSPWTCLLVWLSWLALSGPAFTDETPESTEQADELQFRRVFAPADRIGQWPLGDEPYLPIEASEFQRLVEAAHQADAGTPGAEGVQLATAQYRARLGDRPGEDLLQGDATLTITGKPAAQVLLPLEPLGLAIARARWEGETPHAAALGRGESGRVGVLVDGPGPLKLGWSLRGRRGPQGEIVFSLELPRCATNHLLLDLPARLIPSVDAGVVEMVPGSGAGMRSWRIELGGTHRTLLRLFEAGAAEQLPPALLRQRTTYEFSPRGVEVTAELRLDVQGQPLRQLTVTLDPRLRLVAARSADREIPWTTSETPTGPTRVVLDLPDPLSGVGRTVRLSALATLGEGALWRLPHVSVERVAWLEGTLELVVPKPLVLDRVDVDPIDCTQLSASPLAAPLSGESLEFRCLRAAASVDVLLTRPAEQIHVDLGSIIEMGAAGISCRAVVELSLRQDEQFKPTADLGPDWLIDSVGLADAADQRDAAGGAAKSDAARVETIGGRPGAARAEASDPAVIADWQVESNGGAGKRLVITLKQSVSARQSLRLLVTGHRGEAPPEGLGLKDLEMLQFGQANIGRQWMAVRAVEAHELRIKGSGDLTRIDPQQFTAAEERLFPEKPTGLVFAVDAAARAQRLEIATVPRKPTYTGEINVDVVADGKTLTETYTLRCSSPSARVERAILLCSSARSEPLKFSLAGASGGQITGRRLSAEEQPSRGLSRDGEAWELTLRLPRTGPFEIRAVRSFPFESAVPLSLVALSDASTQRGTLTIRALGETGIGIDNHHRLRLIPAELSGAEFYPTTRGVYRYEPLRDVASADPAIGVHPTASPSGESGAWVWRSQLESRYALRETTIHQATWNVQTRGRSRLTFSLPEGAELRGVSVDELPLPEALVAGFDSSFSVDLPSGKQFVTVALSYVGKGNLPRLAGSLSAAWPEVDVPVLARRWMIWLPPGYELGPSSEVREVGPVASRTWSQRLFGPLGRPAWQTAFHPQRLADWSALLPPREEGGTPTVERVCQALGDVVSAHADDTEPLAWGRLSELLAGSPALANVDVLVDLAALRQIGLRADSPVPAGDQATGAELGRAILDQAELFLLYNDQVVVLTTAAAVTGQDDSLAGDHDRLTGWLGPGPLADGVTEGQHSGDSPRYVPLAIWSRLSAGPDVPWRREAASGVGLWATRGWSVQTIEMGSGSDRSVSVVRPATMNSCAWAVFLLVLAVGLWWKPKTRLWLVSIVAVLAAICLVSPITFVPLTSAAFLAGLSALAWATIDRRRPAEVGERSARSRVPSLVAPVLLLISLALGLNAAARTWAEEPATSGGAKPTESGPSSTAVVDLAADAKNATGKAQALPHVHRVFVPIDAQRRPEGSKLYVPEPLFQELSRRAARASQQPGNWLMTRASYQIVLSRENAQQTVTVAECKAVFDLEVFRAGIELSIPIGKGGVALVPGSAKLDGLPIDMAAGAADHLSLVADQAGQMRLEVGLAPKIESDGSTARFELPTAGLPMSTVSVSFIGEPVAVEIREARGSLVTSSMTSNIQGELGASDVVVVSWPDDRRAAPARPNVEVDELLWVDLQAGAPVIDARFKCRAAQGRVHRLRILADRRLQLLPLGGQSAVAAVHATPGDPAILDLELSEAADQPNQEVIVDLSFLVRDASGIGNFRLPRLEAVGVASAKRLLAVTVDPALHYEEPSGDGVKPQTGGDFLAAWGPASREPQLVYSIDRGMAAWLLTTRPTEVRNVIEQATIFSFGQDSANVRCGATLTTTAGHNFQLRLLGPPGLEIQDVSLIEGGVQRVARWASDKAGAITVFLTGAVSGHQQFLLEGRLRVPIDGEITLSGFQWPGAELKKNQIDVFRQATTLVDMAEMTGATSVEVAPEERLKPEWGRLVASYTLDDPQARLKVHLAANEPQTRGRQVLVVDRDRDVWNATIDLQLHVEHGLIDVLRFDVPSQWVEPSPIEPAARANRIRPEIVPIPSENRRQLIVRPLVPITGDYSLRIRGQLIPTMGDRLGVADLALHGVGQLDRFVVLPLQLGSEQVVWETVGLVPAELPADLQKRLTLTGMRTFHVEGEHFQASLKGIEHTPKTRVLLADVHYAWQNDGDCYGMCAFDLSPAGAGSAELEVPAGLTLVSVTVAGLPAAAVPFGEHGWRFPLGPPQLPQHVEVVFRGTGPLGRAATGTLRLAAPSLVGMEVDKTLWTVYGPPGAGPGEPIDSSAVTATGLEFERLTATRAVLGLADHVASEQIPEEMGRWRALWKERLLAARGRTQRLRLTSTSAGDRKDLETWAREETEIATRLEVAGTVPAVIGSPAFEPMQLFTADASGGASVVGCRFVGSAPMVSLLYPEASRGDFGWRLFAAAVLLAAAAALVWKRPFNRLPRLSAARMLALVGAFWWLWLAPSVVGLAFLVATLAAVAVARLQSTRLGDLTTLPTH